MSKSLTIDSTSSSTVVPSVVRVFRTHIWSLVKGFYTVLPYIHTKDVIVGIVHPNAVFNENP